jgi:predicted transcriptional regulator
VPAERFDYQDAVAMGIGPLPADHLDLGPLEAKVLELLWGHARPLTVREVHLSFPKLAYTTLMTTLDRLHRKAVLVRRRSGRAFAYEPRCSREHLFGEMASRHLTEILGVCGDDTMILSTLVHAVGRRDAALLDELDALVKAERTRLKMEGK